MRHHRWFGLVLSGVCSAIATTYASGPPASAIPIAVDMDGRITLAVRLNGTGPYRFRLDTGATRTVVSARLVRHLHLPDVGESRTLTQAGEARFGLVHLEGLEVGGMVASGLTALSVADGDLDRSRGIDGLVGQDVLSRWPYTIDYLSSRLHLPASPGPIPASVRVPLSRVSGGMIAVVPQPGRPVALRLVPDSGADRLVLFGSADAALPPLTLIEPVRVRSIAGDRAAQLVRVHELDVGGLRLCDRKALLIDRGPPGDAMGDGLLPLHLFARVTIDVAAGYLHLEGRR